MTRKDQAPRLGRGLAALLGEAPAAAGEPTRALAVDLLEPNPFQPRGAMDHRALDELTSSIKASGILQPLLARPHPTSPGRYQLIAGERRWRAAQAAGLHDVPVLIRHMPDGEAMAAALVENLQREDLNAIEEATGYRRLMDEFSLTQEALSSAIGKSRSHIANTLRLLKLPQSVRDQLARGELSPGHARALLGHHDPAAIADAVIQHGLNVRQTEALMERPARDPAQPGRADPETEALARELSSRLGLKVEIAFNGSSGNVRLHYASLEQLDGIVTLLNG